MAETSERKEKAGQEAMQEKVILYQILQKHMESLGQNASLLERRYEELEMTRQALEDINKLKEKNDILVPVGSGFFARGKISDSQSMLADMGAGVFMDKDPASSKSLLEDRKKEIEKLADELQHEMNEVSSRINSLAMELEQASHQEQEHSGKDKGHPHKDD
jgi:prefoldin alpha subunit